MDLKESDEKKTMPSAAFRVFNVIMISRLHELALTAAARSSQEGGSRNLGMKHVLYV